MIWINGLPKERIIYYLQTLGINKALKNYCLILRVHGQPWFVIQNCIWLITLGFHSINKNCYFNS